MSQSKLFDYNSSFAVTRTNPKLTGNFRISIDSKGGIWFNSMDANQSLSKDRFKKFNITGKNTYAKDVADFFGNGVVSNEVIFQVGSFTRGQFQSAQNFAEQYDFYYASGAQALVDKNYPEDFSYFAPLWIKNEIPDFFVVFKIDGPTDYPYSKNVSSISSGTKYKVIQDTDSTSRFVISYGKDSSGSDVNYTNGQIFEGLSNYTTYTVVSGSGKVAVYDELYYLPEVNDVSSTFRNKILNKATVIKTFDLREGTNIGDYIRSIFNNKYFSNSPLEISWGYNSYSYYKGVSVQDGVYTNKGELLNDFLTSSKSDPMIDFEDYVTSGFSRNGIVCPNLLNLEFFFDDPESDLYTINRYMGMYVSRNDIAQIKMNGDFFYDFRNLSGNENSPAPKRNNVGYYYNNTPYYIGATSGVRLFYQDASGFLPGSDNVNLLDSNKLFYLTDKFDNFYSLKRSEEYNVYGGSSPEYSYGPYNYSTGQFSATGSTGATAGSLVIQNKYVNLLDFTGSDDKVNSIKGSKLSEAGRAFIEVEFLQNYNQSKPLTFKLYWPNGSQSEGSRRFDLINSGDFSSVLPWVGGSYYSSGDSYYFNVSNGTPAEMAFSFASILNQVDDSTMSSGIELASSITRVKIPGIYGNENYSLSIFSNYGEFEASFSGNFNTSSTYATGGIVIYDNKYYQSNSYISASSNYPDSSNNWDVYYTFGLTGYVKINGSDVSSVNGSVNFIGGTESSKSRLAFDSKYSNQVQPGYFIKTDSGYSIIQSVNKYVDSPRVDSVTRKITGFSDFNYTLVLNIADRYSEISLGSDSSFNTYASQYLNVGVFSFFDTKEFDFDFWSSDYSYSPTPETYKYYQIPQETVGSIEPNIPYFVKSGQISYANSTYNGGSIFYGVTGYTYFSASDASLNIPPPLGTSIFAETAVSDQQVQSNVIVFPAQYSDRIYTSSSSNYGSNIGYTKDLDSFNGFIGIQGTLLNPLPNTPTKQEVFDYGKLGTEYEYLKENYTRQRANISRLVPYINKWASSIGTDSRGNKYRLNSSPAFSPTNFSPSFDRRNPDPKYLTHEWFLLQRPPRYFPKSFMNSQNSYLAGDIDLSLARNADPDNSLYLSSYFTVEPQDYDSEFRPTNDSSYTKEFFTPLVYNQASGFYETMFRGVKIILKKRSNLPQTGSLQSDRYISGYRGYEDYKFSALLRPVPEDNSIIQSPVKYEVIENVTQKFILFICDIVIKDQKSFNLGYTGSTGGSPVLDYTLLYTLNDKQKAVFPPTDGLQFYSIDDIKLSSGLDLSVSSGSYVNTTTFPGVINISRNPDYDTDLREEIHKIFVENAVGATGGPSSTGEGSFSVSINSGLYNNTYPWPTGVGPSFVEFGRVATGSNYTFDIPYSTLNPVIVPVGPSSVYKNAPVIQKQGGENYYKSLISRISVAYISDRFNKSSEYIKYRSYDWDSSASETIETSSSFELYFERPTKITKFKGSLPRESYLGPKSLVQARSQNGYDIIQGIPDLPSIITRYSGPYEPLFRKVIHFDKDKTDTIIGDGVIDLSFRNCNFSPYKDYFGISKNLSYTKVSEGSNILSAANSYPEGPVYPLIGLTPIDKKDFNLFMSSWDTGYYNRYVSATTQSPVAGTRSMKEYKTFFGSKVMQTPDPVQINNYITLEVSRNNGITDVTTINSEIDSYVNSVQYITRSNSNTGIGSVGPYNSAVDVDKMDLTIFPNAEVVWQYFPEQKKIRGTIRLDRMLRRYLLNSGVKKVFVDNMISEFGVGNPRSIDDDVNNYIELNVAPIYKGDAFDLYVKKSADGVIPSTEIVRGDLSISDRFKMEYFIDTNYKLVKQSDLVFSFEYTTESNFYYSLLFSFTITKI